MQLGLVTDLTIEEPQSAERRRIAEEIVQTEAAIEHSARSIESMVRDSSIELSRIMRARARHNELLAYLRGLKFHARL